MQADSPSRRQRHIYDGGDSVIVSPSDLFDVDDVDVSVRARPRALSLSINDPEFHEAVWDAIEADRKKDAD